MASEFLQTGEATMTRLGKGDKDIASPKNFNFPLF